MQDPEAGHLVKSPKTFLGSDLRAEQLNFFKDVSASILGFMKNKAETQLDATIDKVVLGRPVHFHGTKGAASDRQAEDLLRNAAEQVGFKEIEFMLEPIAAALHFEQSLTKDMQVLVLDIGERYHRLLDDQCIGPDRIGSMARRGEALLGYYARDGAREGSSLDIQLAINQLMPALGRGRCAVPDQVYWDAAKVNDIPAQSRFLSATRGHELEMHWGAGAGRWQLDRALNRIALQRADALRLNRLALSWPRSSSPIMSTASYRWTTSKRSSAWTSRAIIFARRDQHTISESFLQLVIEVENQAGIKPDLVYVTGGTAKSPIVQSYLNSHLTGYPIEYGNLFGSVGSGLTAWAGHIFR